MAFQLCGRTIGPSHAGHCWVSFTSAWMFFADSHSANGYGTYLIFCSFAFTMFFFVWFFIPEVRDDYLVSDAR